MKRTTATFVIVSSVALGFAGGEVPSVPAPRQPAPARVPGRIPPKKIGPPAGNGLVKRDAPLLAPYRPIGWGFNCQEFYGPTYYYPSYHNQYEGLNPTYYPFYHPRLWPNYKTDALYCPGTQCGASRSLWQWDSYDDWTRGARYEEHQ